MVVGPDAIPAGLVGRRRRRLTRSSSLVFMLMTVLAPRWGAIDAARDTCGTPRKAEAGGEA
jgi:hypothetical protein